MSLFELKFKIGTNLKTARLASEYSVKGLALKLKVEPITVYKYESGELLPSIEVLIKYSKLFKVSTDEILGLRRK